MPWESEIATLRKLARNDNKGASQIASFLAMTKCRVHSEFERTKIEPFEPQRIAKIPRFLRIEHCICGVCNEIEDNIKLER